MSNKLPILIVMVGLQCSGKSTQAIELAKENNAMIVSSDSIRSQNKEWDNDKVFKHLYSQVNDYLSRGLNTIIDATNITIKARKQIFSNLKVDCGKICYIMNTPIEECRKRLEERNNSNYPNKVPLEILDKYYKSFEIPFWEEGWDNMYMNKKLSYDDFNNYSIKIFSKCKGFDQHNKHHTQNLLEHLKTTRDYIINVKKDINYKSIVDFYLSTDLVLTRAASFHDIGKLYTQFYKPNDENAHYYNHANVGAYELLCNAYNNLECDIELIFYVNYHMKPHDWQSDKSKEKWKKIFGEEKYNNLLLLNEADKYRGENNA